MPSLHTTRVSLFCRIGGMPVDSSAWTEFVGLYAPAVLQWCRRRGLQESDAHDVAQDVLLRFWRQAGSFRYDPARRFRSYLRRMVASALADWGDARRGDRLPADEPAFDSILDNAPAREDLAASLEKVFDMERLAAAMREVEARVKPRTWQAFRMLAIERLPGKRVAEELGMSQANAYMARMNVQRMISATIRRADESATAG